ncbi:MAG: NAD(P)H-dependent oxidoreductase [Candidatus Thermoplasmatota archaeon]|nr:NAD(P)H-dependent oxidoreductase [Candidatus Thermoplasmatota archaeon]MBS3802146.1 NAD(P)H-dependent oxidoreductase [Candidatus Thermoplasmatota archaeon]
MKIGILFYSKSGNTKQIGERIKKQSEKKNHAVDIVEVNPESEPGFFKASFSAIRQKQLPITNDTFDVSSYDLIFVGCPIWVGKPAPLIKSMIQKTTGFDNTKASVFITCGGGEKPGSNAVDLIKYYLQNQQANILDETLIVHMNRKGKIRKEIPSVEDFVNNTLESL